MWGRMATLCFKGLQTIPIDVQAKLTPGLPSFHIVGLPDKAVAESKERVRSALYSLGISLPPKRIVINLSPADLRKEGSHYDVPIALALLSALGTYGTDALTTFVAIGELGLDGSFVQTGGGLSAALHAHTKRKSLICAEADGVEAAWAGDQMSIVAAPHLLALHNHFKGVQVLQPPRTQHVAKEFSGPDMNEVQGHAAAKRALLIAAAGGHNMLMIGPPGVGKSMLAERLPGLLPPLMPYEALEVTMIHSLSATNATQGALHYTRPFRAPHHSTSVAALVGGGLKVSPGEISLAHRGVLFCDELPEFKASHLEALRQPLESGQVVIARANEHVTYPARFQLIAAMNPCPCGHLGQPALQCKKAPTCAQRYQSKISGPLLDRLDMRLHIQSPTSQSKTGQKEGASSKQLRTLVEKVWAMQAQRYVTEAPPQSMHKMNAHERHSATTHNKSNNAQIDKRGCTTTDSPNSMHSLEEPTKRPFILKNTRHGAPAQSVASDTIDARDSCTSQPHAFLNGQVAMTALAPHLHLEPQAETLLAKAVKRWHLSVRGEHKVLRLARTIADLACSHTIGSIHVAEALSYRAALNHLHITTPPTAYHAS